MAADRDKILEDAQSLVEKKRFDKAIAEYQKLLAADPKDARVVLKLGEAFLKAERYENAVAAFEQVAQLHAAAGFAMKAIAAYQQARDLVQKQLPHLSDRFGHFAPRMADLYIQLKRAPEAIQIYEESAARMEAAGRPRDAIDFYKKIADLDTQTPERTLRLADALLRVGDPEAAAPRFAAAAETLATRGRHDEALDAAERAIAITPTPQLCRLAAQLYLGRGGPRDAQAAFLKVQIAYKHGPKDLQTLGLLAQSLYVLRQPDRAIEVHKEAARIAEATGNAEVFDAHMETLVARAAGDPEVRKLASRWSKAPPGFVARESAPPATPPPRLTPLPTPPPQMAPPFPTPTPLPGTPVPSAPRRPAPNPHTPHAADASPRASAAAPAGRPDDAASASLHPRGPSRPSSLRRAHGGASSRRRAVRGAHGSAAAAPARRRAVWRAHGRAGASSAGVRALRGSDGRASAASRPAAVRDAHGRAAASAGPASRSCRRPPPARPLPPPPPGYGAPIGAPSSPFVPPPPPSHPGVFAAAVVMAPPPPPSMESAPISLDPNSMSMSGPPSMGRGRFDEEAIEEVEFFVAQGMFEDALSILAEQLQRLPNHPLLLERTREVEEMAEAARGEAGT